MKVQEDVVTARMLSAWRQGPAGNGENVVQTLNKLFMEDYHGFGVRQAVHQYHPLSRR